MARTGKKEILIDLESTEHLEMCIKYAERKSKGLRLNVDFNHSTGLILTVTGPKDRINIFEHQIREYVELLIQQE